MDGTHTGVEEYAVNVLHAMMEIAQGDTFVLFANSRRPIRLPTFAAPNVTVRRFGYPNTIFNLSLKALRAPALDRLVGGVDVFFVPAFRLAPLSDACPLVLTVHDLSFVRYPQFFSPDRRLWHRLMNPKQLAHGAALVLAVSEATARDIHALYDIPDARITVVHSGIPERMRRLLENDPLRHVVHARYQLPKQYLLFLGTLEPRKNLESLLDAYTAVRRAGLPHALVLAGVRGWIPEDFFARVRAHPYASDIRWTGFIHDDDKPAVYSCADLFVYPSYYEGFGFPPLEALACGTPVVTSRTSAMPEVAGPWAALVNPYDPEELAAVLIDRLRYPSSVPEEGSAQVRTTYSWKRAGAETLRALREAASGKSEIRNPNSETVSLGAPHAGSNFDIRTSDFK
jgi:glycosyltransferase involved in cell wall biosynthesis